MERGRGPLAHLSRHRPYVPAVGVRNLLRLPDMKLNAPTLGFLVATRAVLGVGLGLLLSEKLSRPRRRSVGLTLLSVGAATTVPAAIAFARARRQPRLVRAIHNLRSAKW